MPSAIYYWEDVLRLESEIDWKAVLQFKFGKLFDNRIKQFNFKLFHKIVPSKSNLYRWQISTDDMCNICKEKETTMHYAYLAFVKAPAGLTLVEERITSLRC